VQPHRYSRLHDLFSDFSTCFTSADKVIVADIYAAGETPIEGVTRDALVAAIQKSGHPYVTALESPEMPASLPAGS
jgi:UDP-N-acetylmuramate--alanine ligase